VTLRELPREALRLCTRPGLFRFYLGLALVSWSANAALAPFIAYYLKVEAGVPEQRILTFTAAQFAGQIAGSSSIRAAIDRVPLRRFFQLACLGFVGIALFWLAVVEGAGLSRGLFPVAYFVFGAAAGISNAAHFTLLPELSAPERRPVAISVFTSILGVVAGLAPIAWGLVLKAPGPGPGLQLGRFAAFFGVAAAANALLLLGFQGLSERRSAVS
jgi:hypothetical protein